MWTVLQWTPGCIHLLKLWCSLGTCVGVGLLRHMVVLFFFRNLQTVFHFPSGSDGKVGQCGRPRFSPWVGKIPWRRKWQSTPVLLPGKSHEQRSLVGYSPWGRKESDTTEQLHVHVSGEKSFLIWNQNFLHFVETSSEHDKNSLINFCVIVVYTQW